jgi:DNA-binding MarR family transcriptional regulator/GNAT superfamily N-acetyltransferase
MNHIEQVRQFNRTIGQQIGILKSDFLGRKRPYGASRVLYEIGENGLEVRALRARLDLDSGYTSRLLRMLEKEKLVELVPSVTDARVRFVRLTEMGFEELVMINQLSEQVARSILEPLNEKQQNVLVDAMQIVNRFIQVSAITIRIEDPSSPAAKVCLTNYYQELQQRFEAGFNPEPSGGNALSANEMRLPQGQLLLAWLHGKPVGCGAIRFYSGYGEIKRMWLSPAVRGLGLSRRILARLEAVALEHGLSLVRLDTNKALPEAIALYQSSGYVETERYSQNPYAHYWFEKKLI